MNTNSPTTGFELALDEGPEVNHFNYFVNPESARWVLRGLAPDDERSKEFEHVAGVPAERRPTAWILPSVASTI